MPVSHGGGFSGGSHGGSFSSSGSRGSGSSASHRFSMRPFPGAMMYVYIGRGGRRHQFYSSEPPKRQNIPLLITAMSIFLLAVIAFTLFASTSVFPSKISNSYCEPTGIYFHDGAGIIEDTASFNASMQAFYEATGAEPYVYTLREENFPTHAYGALTKYTLEDFAYDLYLDTFDDEGHYMIVFAKYSNGEWLWLDMAGTDTTGLIDDAAFEVFQDEMNTKLGDTAYTDKGKAVAECFDLLAKEVFVVTVGDYVATILIILLGLGIAVAIIVGTVQLVKQANIINGYCDYAEAHPGKAQGHTTAGDHASGDDGV